MKLSSIVIALGAIWLPAGVQAQDQPLKLIRANALVSKYHFENDLSLLEMFARWTIMSNYEMTYSGRYELPLVPELRNIQAVSFRDAIEQAMSAYKNYQLDVIMQARLDDTKRHLYLTSISVADQSKTARQNPIVEADFSVKDNDKSLMQLLVRWATQAGYTSVINGQLVNLAVFPTHSIPYADYTVINNAKSFKSKSHFKEVVSQLLILYSGKSMAPFIVSVEDSTKRLIISSLVK